MALFPCKVAYERGILELWKRNVAKSKWQTKSNLAIASSSPPEPPFTTRDRIVRLRSCMKMIADVGTQWEMMANRGFIPSKARS